MKELKEEDIIMLSCVVTDKGTGLEMGVFSPSPYLETPEGTEVNFLESEVPFFKDMFVVGMTYDHITEYRVKNPLDIPKLFEIVNRGESSAYIAIAPEVVDKLVEEAKSE